MTESPERALQTLIGDTLKADQGVVALIKDRVFDKRPSPKTGGKFPCVTFGPSDTNSADEEGIEGDIVFMQLDVWSRDQGRRGPCLDIVWAVREALHDKNLYMEGFYALHSLRVVTKRAFIDPDGVTAHGVISLRAILEVRTDG